MQVACLESPTLSTRQDPHYNLEPYWMIHRIEREVEKIIGKSLGPPRQQD